MSELHSKPDAVLVPTAVPPKTGFPFPGEEPNEQPTEASTHAHNATDGDEPPNLPSESSAPAARSPPIRPVRSSTDPTTATEATKNDATKITVPLIDEHIHIGEVPVEEEEELDNDDDDQSSSSEDSYSDFSSSSSESENEDAQSRKKRRKLARFNSFCYGDDSYSTKGRVSRRDGRLKISLNETANRGYLAKALGATIRHHLFSSRSNEEDPSEAADDDVEEAEKELQKVASNITEDGLMAPRPQLNIVIIVIGSRGDIQPFMKIGKILQNDYGHRVRIATHPAFREFVTQDCGLEFFSVGGNPSELMAFMVKNPGLIPSLETVKQGEIGKRRAQMYEMFEGMWRACINSTDTETDKENLKMMGKMNPFVADAIIANPPSFAHIHIAERLGIPLHMMFTFPYTPTVHFPHPLANIKYTNVDANYSNFMSYPLVELMTWQGLGDLVNKFRTKTLGLEPVSRLWAPGQLYRLKVPYTYMWSPSLVAKPKDWGPEINISGFVFLDLASSYKPPQELMDFLDAGEPPVYIGFGSIVVDDAEKFTEMIFKAVELAGVRALVSKGWGGLGGTNVPDNIFMLDNTPHDWLFPKVKAVVHHGGAGTTAIGLKCGKPTMIVPFFGDQPFWGSMVAAKKAGAFECIPYKRLTAEKLAEGIKQCLSEEAQKNVQKIADSIEREGDGAANAVRSFHRALPVQGNHNMRCFILPERVAVWQLKENQISLSAVAAEILVEKKIIKWHDLRLTRHTEWTDYDGPGEPVTGSGSAMLGTAADIAKGIGSVPIKAAKSIRRRGHHEWKKRKWEERRSMDQQSEQPNGTVNEPSQQNDQPARPKPARRLETQLSVLSAEPTEHLAEEIIHDTGRGLAETGKAIAKAPMDFTLAVAQGFHNAPRLYGDPTVRRPPRISGFHSGLRAGRDEFLYGVYDGFTGLVTQPIRGGRDGGFLGAVKGFGYGIGGFVLKDAAAIVGPFAYTFKGMHKELQKRNSPEHFIRKARIIEGQKEVLRLRRGQPSAGVAMASDANLEGSSGNSLDGRTTDRTDAYKEVVNRVVEGWQTYRAIIGRKESAEAEGLSGKIRAWRITNELSANGAMENVDMLDRALKARLEGRPIDKEVLEFRLDHQHTAPRKSLTEDKEADKAGKAQRAAQPVSDTDRVTSIDGLSGQTVTEDDKRDVSPKRPGDALLPSSAASPPGHEHSGTQAVDWV